MREQTYYVVTETPDRPRETALWLGRASDSLDALDRFAEFEGFVAYSKLMRVNPDEWGIGSGIGAPDENGCRWAVFTNTTVHALPVSVDDAAETLDLLRPLMDEAAWDAARAELDDHREWLRRKKDGEDVAALLAPLAVGTEFKLRDVDRAYNATYRKNEDGSWDQLKGTCEPPHVVNIDATHLGFVVGLAPVERASKYVIHGRPLDAERREVDDVAFYYAIPTNYTIGDTFDTLDEALAEARRREASFIDHRRVVSYADGGSSDEVYARITVVGGCEICGAPAVGGRVTSDALRARTFCEIHEPVESNGALLPVDLVSMLDDVAKEACQAAFAKIAERLEELGYPVSGDVSPAESTQLDRDFQGYVRMMATNNEKIGSLQ